MCANSLVRYISRWALCGLGPPSGSGSLHVGEGWVLCHVSVPGLDGSTNDVPELPHRGAGMQRMGGGGGGLVHGRGCIPQSLQAATVTVTVEHTPLSLRTHPRSWSGESLQELQNGVGAVGLDGHEETRRGCGACTACQGDSRHAPWYLTDSWWGDHGNMYLSMANRDTRQGRYSGKVDTSFILSKKCAEGCARWSHPDSELSTSNAGLAYPECVS
jgi:hypothetical protein